MARLAASSPLARAKNAAGYFLLPVRSILNRCDSPRVPFEWTINPYRGCEFGCRYCYARYTHEYMELEGGDFESKIFVKQNAAALLARELEERAARLAPIAVGARAECIALGTATDPYQPAEREHGVTRSLLEKLAARDALHLSITTKSNLIVRDLDLLKTIARRSDLSVNITVTTLRPRLARALEPRAPRPDLRLEALRRLREAGIPAGVFCMPVLPGLTDSEADLEAVARAAREAGAEWLGGQVLFLMPSSLRQFLPFLEAKSPRLARQYRKWYARSAYAPEEYRRRMAELFARIRRRHALASRPYAPDRAALSLSAPQLTLPLTSVAPAA
jgi:DNA repair photolyase